MLWPKGKTDVGISGNSRDVCAQIRGFMETDLLIMCFEHVEERWLSALLFFFSPSQVWKVSKAAFRRRAGSSEPCVWWRCSSSLRSWPALSGET